MHQAADDPRGSPERAATLKALFEFIDPIEITGSVDLQGKSPLEIAQMLPRFTTLQQEGTNPAFGILVDSKTGRAWSLRSGLSPKVIEEFLGIKFRTGTLAPQVLRAAGGAWANPVVPLGSHVEGQAAAFMRKMAIEEAVLYINGSMPCKNGGLGCYYRLPELLAENSRLTVYNKRGRAFLYTGIAD